MVAIALEKVGISGVAGLIISSLSGICTLLSLKECPLSPSGVSKLLSPDLKSWSLLCSAMHFCIGCFSALLTELDCIP